MGQSFRSWFLLKIVGPTSKSLDFFFAKSWEDLEFQIFLNFQQFTIFLQKNKCLNCVNKLVKKLLLFWKHPQSWKWTKMKSYFISNLNLWLRTWKLYRFLWKKHLYNVFTLNSRLKGCGFESLLCIPIPDRNGDRLKTMPI